MRSHPGTGARRLRFPLFVQDFEPGNAGGAIDVYRSDAPVRWKRSVGLQPGAASRDLGKLPANGYLEPSGNRERYLAGFDQGAGADRTLVPSVNIGSGAPGGSRFDALVCAASQSGFLELRCGCLRFPRVATLFELGLHSQLSRAPAAAGILRGWRSKGCRLADQMGGGARDPVLRVRLAPLSRR